MDLKSTYSIMITFPEEHNVKDQPEKPKVIFFSKNSCPVKMINSSTLALV